MARILIVDDEESIRGFIAEALSLDHHSIEQAQSAEEALRLATPRRFDLVVTDLKMPGAGGLELLRRLKAEQPLVEVIVLTAYGTVDTAVEAMKLGAFDYLQKPLKSPAALRQLVKRAVEKHPTRNKEVTAPEQPLTYGDPAMRPIVDALTKVARTNTTVLLLGESGTGKEVAARFLHKTSTRRAGPFIAINCAALSENLLASELFGHEKGAFTGANERHKGRIEQAEGGTFFLDEVAELKPELQAKLLRVLQERRFERVGGTQTLEADVRFIAATNRNLKAMMEEGKLREDLYHRLAVFPVRLPSLRERIGDIVPLSLTLLKKISQASNRGVLKLTEDACRKLLEYDWPGNIRELENTLERATILVEGDTLNAKSLWLDPNTRKSSESPRTLQELEQEAVLLALQNANGNRRIAAESLGIGLRTLYDKMKRFGIE
jgi:two-component system, NtrC family, response regulator AtoC